MDGDLAKRARWYWRKLNQRVPVDAGMRAFRERLPGYSTDQWQRALQLGEWKQFLRDRDPGRLDVLEISPGNHAPWRDFGFRSYRSVDYPEFDLTRDVLPETFDVVIAEHVFEHLRHPYRAARHVRQMLRDDGVFLITTPFLIKLHGAPHDYTRWTPQGMQAFLEDCGFEADVRAWGNRQVVIANFLRWPEYGWGVTRRMRNEPYFPVVVWAYARPRPGAAP